MNAHNEAKELFEAMFSAIGNPTRNANNVIKAKECALVAIQAQKDTLALVAICKHQQRQSPSERVRDVEHEINLL